MYKDSKEKLFFSSPIQFAIGLRLKKIMYNHFIVFNAAYFGSEATTLPGPL